ncbi:MAG: MBL fold metallo-hydrolase [Allosphingosinicella sp.]|uniref:hydroxyacylglutathione hydrolase family protein n=1 Tax=Allosphingosinicella sp. TaxID=2823234 RepID=UPI00395E3300
MTVLASPVGNSYAHISYLLFCPETHEAAAIDPFHLDVVTEAADRRGLRITTIINTHEHWDHAGRNEQLRALTGAKVMAPRAAAGVIERIDVPLSNGDEIELGSLRLKVRDTPGHTMTHISLLGEDADGPYLLSGDTLFGAGVGNCGYGGHAATLFTTIESLRGSLAGATRIFPGHDYLARNLEFTCRHEPSNRAAALLLEDARAGLRLTTFDEELGVNLFLRLDSPELRASLAGQGYAALGASREEIFLALRRLRDAW